MSRRWLCWGVLVCVLGASSTLHADMLIYEIPGSGSHLMFQGKIVVNPGATVTYTHPTLSQPLYFGLNQVKILRVPTTQQEYQKRVSKAGKNADDVFKAAVWALKKGLLREYYAGVKKALDLNPKHEAATNVMKLKAEMDKPLPDSAQEEADIRKIVKKSGMRAVRSKHFILLTDTPEKKSEGRKKNRADERLALMEQVYESFLLLFYSQDVELDIPKERMRVVLFNDYKDYLDFATGVSPDLSSASGFWEQVRNVSIFYDHGTDEQFVALQKMQKELQQISDEVKRQRVGGAGEVVRLNNTLKMLIDIAQENADIEVVSHEATHQMAGNTGLFPRHVMVPSWVHEGLATYFESPGDASWSGIGAVNEQRLTWYRALEPDREHSNINFIVGDQIFDFTTTHGGKLHGYGQAWALTHFLLETHLKEFVAYYRLMGEMPPDVILSPELLTEIFDKVFGTDRKDLDQEWRTYMRSLKTDLEKLEESEEKKGR